MDAREELILGALLHDIGKFGQRAEVECRYKNDETEMQAVCKYHEHGRYFTHTHSLWTSSFLEDYKTYILKSINTFDNADDNMINFARKHHNPDTNIQKIITEADQLSSGMDRKELSREEQEELHKKQKHKRVRLKSVIELIDISDRKKITADFAYNLSPLTNGNEIFAKKLKDNETLEQEYKKLWDGFISEFVNLKTENFHSYFNGIFHLLYKYTWCIPSSTLEFPADISLFDHLKTTAAITACLYDYHNALDDIEQVKNIQDRYSNKYLLVGGDLSGIQKFIYNISSKGAAKGLKGRSFYLQYLAESICEYILKEFNLTLCNQIYASGGNFYLLLPICQDVNGTKIITKDKLKEINKHINKILLEKHKGELYLGIGAIELCGKDLLRIGEKWNELVLEIIKSKKQKFKDFIISNYDMFFDPSGLGGYEKTCKICGKEEIVEESEEMDKTWCRECFELERLGRGLSHANYIMIIHPRDEGEYNNFINSNIKILNQSSSYYPDPDLYNASKELNSAIILLKENTEIIINPDLKPVIYKINDTENFIGDNKNIGYGVKFFGGNKIPKNEFGEPLTFDEIANKSSGIKRLGILRMDVDNLGAIFQKGLANIDGKNLSTISRVTTLSNKLTQFFSGYLNEIINDKKYENKCQIIYSGGDDLFIIGSWDIIPDIAMDIHDSFNRFCCFNPDITISGGISMIPKKYPIHKGAAYAGEAEMVAKTERENPKKEKDSITFLDKPLSWHDFNIAASIKENLIELIEEDSSKSLLNRLKEIYILYETNRNFLTQKNHAIETLQNNIRYNKWMWIMVYSLERYAKQNKEIKEDLENIKQALLKDTFNGQKSESEIIKYIDIPTRWAEFLTRKEK